MDELVKILIIEDDATIRTILEMALLGAGFKPSLTSGSARPTMTLME